MWQTKEETAEVHFYPIIVMLGEMRMVKMKVTEETTAQGL